MSIHKIAIMRIIEMKIASTNLWIEEDFAEIDFGDKRLVKRFKDILCQFFKKAQSNISSIFDSWASIKACYRFFDNKKIKAEDILNKHIKSSVLRINDSNELIIVIHDTCYVDYKNRKK